MTTETSRETIMAASVVPHNGWLTLTVIASLLVCIATATAAIELKRNVAAWLIGSFVITFVAISLLHAAIARS